MLRYAVGALLCGLLLVYALGAKLALYHTGQPGARSVAATKAWEDHAASVETQVAPVLAAPVVLCLSVLAVPAVAVVWTVAPEPLLATPVRGFSPHLSVRPPPVF